MRKPGLVLVLRLLLFPVLAGERLEWDPPIAPQPGYGVRGLSISKGVPSPTGDKVAFIAGRGYQDEEVFVWHPATDALQNVTRNFGSHSVGDRLVWSPDGQAIAATMHPLPSGINPMYVLRLDGSPPKRLAGRVVSRYAWAPDSRRIAYEWFRHVYVVAADGTGRKQLTKTKRTGINSLVWWRDGDREVVAFIAGWLQPERHVFVAPLDGSGARQITQEPGYGDLRLDADGVHLTAIRIPELHSRTMEHVRIAPRSHAREIAGHSATHWERFHGTTKSLGMRARHIEWGGPKPRVLDKRRIAAFHFRQRLEHATRRAAATPLTLVPDPRKHRPQGPMKLLEAKRSAGHGETTRLAQLALEPRKLQRHVRLGPVSLELLGIKLRPQGKRPLRVEVALRYMDRIDSAVAELDGRYSYSFELQRQHGSAGARPHGGGIRGWHRAYSVAIASVTADPATGVWSKLTLELLRYDEALGEIRIPEPPGPF